MERDLSVNAVSETDDPAGSFAFPSSGTPANRPARTSLGACLYLGPAGQRCSRPGQEGGFCLQHQPNGPSASTPVLSPRRVGVILTILALLWPILADVLRELILLFR